MAKLTGNTAGSLKKMWPPVKKKAMETHPSFATFLGLKNDATTTTTTTAAPGAEPKPKAKGGRKRKADTNANAEEGTTTDTAADKSGDEKKGAPGKKGRAKKVKSEDVVQEEEVVKDEVKDEEDSADGGDGLGEYTLSSSMEKWLWGACADCDAEKKEAEEETEV